MLKKITRSAFFTVVVLFLLNACKSNKELMYLQNLPQRELQQGIPFSVHEYQLRTSDNLYIQVTSLNPEVNLLFNPSSGTGYSAGTAQQYGTLSAQYLNGYQIDPDGNVELPIIGKVPVLGKTVAQAKEGIVERVSEYFKEATVTVKLLSFKFTVMGEVARPGVYYNYNNTCTILEAISQASGTTDYSRLRKAMVLREQEGGSYSIEVDLTDKALLSSEAYYLQPNDVIYVTPDKYKNTRLNASLYALMLSTVSTFIVILKFLGE
ncbi:polysaccharide biosynthesis/export family protein [Gaoshiqia sediminis]|uniref:Polysaccharide export protein n=1 Tax=Gaoshiqia sediminis TaxID=2986998 RepID=A0AA41Y6N3_9BACT|nr:polysaccharide biosynthesis/export family protein [Gaoshiqia sediminis]MCW0481888.1 polysaccharide export protein [Gaoshiqia sediminis]